MAMTRTDEVVMYVKHELALFGDTVRASKEKAYMKSLMRFHGVRKPQVNALVRSVKRRWQNMALDRVLAISECLWASEFYEERSAAVGVAALYESLLQPKHVTSVFQHWLEQADSWGHVDELSIRVVGAIALRSPEVFGILSEWEGSPCLWVRRASLVAHLPSVRKDAPRLGDLERACHRLVAEKQFFIRKAIGWVLRELSEHRPDETERILLGVGRQASGLSVREAIRKMPQRRQRSILSSLNRGCARK